LYDDRPSPWLTGLTVFLAWIATSLTAPALANFWHVDGAAAPLLGAAAGFAVAAAWWPWLYALVPLAAAAVLYWFPALREGLWLDATVWYTDIRLGLWPGPYGLLAWVALALAVLGFACLFVREPLRRGTAYWTFFGGTLAFGHMWLWGSDTAARQYGFFLAAVVPLWVIAAASWREHRWHGAGRRVVAGPAWAAPAIGAVLLAVLAGWVLPARSRPLELWGLTAWARATFPALEQMRGGAPDEDAIPQGFTLATAGFARRVSELGGPIKPAQGVAFTVRFPEAAPTAPVFLRGTAMTNYNGRGWVTETKPGDVGADSPPLSQELKMEIGLVRLGHSTLLYPRELAEIDGVTYSYGREGHIFAKEPLMGTYTVTALLPAGRPAGFLPPMFDPGRYLALPKNLPPRVAALAKEIGAGKASRYDEALAVEAYLRSFDYATDVPATPPGRDFVDYFLFDLKRGYCAYSATAMTVMLRTRGIPTRWVQGFVVEPGRPQVDVTFNNAHAWVEAYFPGYGWAVFDPTPRFDLPDREAAAAQVELSAVPEGDGPAVEPEAVEKSDAAAGGEHQKLPWVWIAGGLGALAWVATSFRRFFRERIDWTDERRGVLQAFAQLLAALRRMGFRPQAYETAIEYADGVARAWPEVGSQVRQAAAQVTAARFAPPGAPAPPGARRTMGGALAAVWFGAQSRWGVIRTAWIRLRFVWGKD